jgi:beta-N-acetylhexosaminidase
MTRRELRRHIGQLVIVGFDGLAVPDDLVRLARAFDLGGVILFERNVESPAQVRELVRELAAFERERPLWVGVDQEGGRVARLKAPFTEWPPAITLGRAGDQRLARRFGQALAAELRAVGINLDFAPVADVWTNPANTVIGDRALGDRAPEVARLARAIVQGLQAGGVAACAKHFPGHGDTSADSHDTLPIVEHPLERLREVEFAPFRAVVEAQVAAVMTGHLLVPALDETAPATWSRPVVERWLRGELGHAGIVITDDLFMRAVTDRLSPPEAAVRAVAAGHDLVLLARPEIEQHVRVLEALIYAAEADASLATRVEAAMARGREVQERLFGPETLPPAPRDWRGAIGCDEHAAIAREMARFL